MRAGLSTKAVSALTIVAFIVFAAIEANHFAFPDFSGAGRALSAVVFVAGAYENLLWRWIPLPGGPPNLRGTWQMQLTPQNGPEGISRTEMTCYLAIRQTMLTVNADLLFDDGESKVTSAMLVKDRDQRRVLVFYDFEPNTVTKQEPRRKGAASLKIVTRRGLRGKYLRIAGGFQGKYWNDVGISGDLLGTRRSRRMFDTFASAAKGSYS